MFCILVATAVIKQDDVGWFGQINIEPEGFQDPSYLAAYQIRAAGWRISPLWDQIGKSSRPHFPFLSPPLPHLFLFSRDDLPHLIAIDCMFVILLYR